MKQDKEKILAELERVFNRRSGTESYLTYSAFITPSLNKRTGYRITQSNANP